MEDGSKVVGLFNRGDQETAMTVQWPEVGVRGKQAVRDLWRQKDLGAFRGPVLRPGRTARRGADPPASGGVGGASALSSMV